MKTSSTFEYKVLTVDPFGKPENYYLQTSQGYIEQLNSETTLELVSIPSGQIEIGASGTEEGWQPCQAPRHRVQVQSFWMSRFPITQAQWKAIASFPAIHTSLHPQPSCFVGDRLPVEQVSWYDTLEFCARLSVCTGRDYRLPTEAEWEYACRAGTETPFHFGETITTDLANYSGVDWEYLGKICSKGSYGQAPAGCDRRQTTEVGEFHVANAYGLFDLHGQVREWCHDCWHDTYDGAPSDGSAWVEGDGDLRVLRGGSWNVGPRACRSSSRSRLSAESNLYDVGFRVVCSTP
jgi:formylglycine-generating enzyme required for sulfatase activity